MKERNGDDFLLKNHLIISRKFRITSGRNVQLSYRCFKTGKKIANRLALPYLLKHVYTHGSDEVIRRGKKIHSIGFVELVEHDYLFSSITFRVKDDTYSTFYKVYVQNYKDYKNLSLRCACPYNLGDICRHQAAALMRLQEMIDKGMLQENEVQYDQHHTGF